jgi:hypothetical protein
LCIVEKEHNLSIFLTSFDVEYLQICQPFKLIRVITTPFGHALAVGIGGFGRKSLSQLASSIVNFFVMGIVITKKYNE